jgi:DNA (cytosine-5)-methyltransferase 1
MVDQQSNDERLRELALFAGAGGGILGGLLLGWRTVCAVERDAYCAAVLAQRQDDGILPPFPIWSDIETFDGRPWRGVVDVVSGGFPCQAFSNAAHGRNTARDMWVEMLRIIGQVCPAYILAENVSESSIGSVQIDLKCCGYKTLRAPIGASDLGADHIRRRWWLFAYSNDKSKLVGKVYAKTQVLSKFCASIWKTNPGKPRVDDGMANRMDRFRAIGNGQVPICMATAFRILSGEVD